MSLGFMRSNVILTLMTSLFSFTLIGSINAQTGTSAITGVVTDQTGAAVPGVKVTISNPLTKFTRETTSNDVGIYSFTGIPPTTYKLKRR